jgi:hypothetical protein
MSTKYDFYTSSCQYNDHIGHQIADYECLQKYDERNKHFCMEVVTINEEEEERIIRYDCVYRYETHEVKLEYDISVEKWTMVSDKYHMEEEKLLKAGIQRVNWYSSVNVNYTLDEQIQHILKIFDDYFLSKSII